MEYDRALYRVYERIMEDLNASPSPMASSSPPASAGTATLLPVESPSSSRRRRERRDRRRRHRRGRGSRRERNDGQDGNNETADDGQANISEEGTGNEGRSENNILLSTQNNAADGNENVPETDNQQSNQNSNEEQRRRRRRNRRSRSRRQFPRQQNLSVFTGNISRPRTQPPLPFLLPIWMANKLEQFRNRASTRGERSNVENAGFLAAMFFNLRGFTWTPAGGNALLERTPSAPSSPRTTYRSLLISTSHSPGGSSHRDSDEEHYPSMDEEEMVGENREIVTLQMPALSAGETPASPRADGLRRRAASTSSNSSPTRRSDQNSAPHTSSSTSSSSASSSSSPTTSRYNNSNNINGNSPGSPTRSARRNHSISPPHTPEQNQSRRMLQPRNNRPPSPAVESSSSSLMYSSQSSSTSSSEEMTLGGNNPSNGRGRSTGATTLAQRAIQMQNRVSLRMSSSLSNRQSNRGRQVDDSDSEYDSESSDDGEESNDENSQAAEVISSASSSSSSDDDPYSGGCSQKNIYFIMRLSFGVGLLHIFILLCLHVTYVGPYAFHKKKSSSPLRRYLAGGLRHLQQQLGTLGGVTEKNKFLRWLEEIDNEDTKNYHQDATINCISYALSTRSVEDRGNYFAMFGDGESNDTKRRRLSENDDNELYYYDEEYSTTNGAMDDEGEFYFHSIYPLTQREIPEKKMPLSKMGSPLLGKDEVLQLKIIYGGKCTGQCSRVRNVKYPSKEEKLPASADNKESEKSGNNSRSLRNISVSADAKENDEDAGFRLRGRQKRTKRRLKKQIDDSLDFASPVSNHMDILDQLSKNFGQIKGILNDASQTLRNTEVDATTNNNWRWDQYNEHRRLNDSNDEEDTSDIEEDEFSSQSFWEEPHYRFSIDDALLYMDTKSAFLHNITLVNVTVTERCLSTGSDDGNLSFLTAAGEFFSQIFGMDSVIINQLMYGIRAPDGSLQGGHMQSMETKERWGWRKDQLDAYEPNWSILDWLLKKIGILSMSLLAFFLITSVTSLIVRVLTSSGVVLMFPLFSCFRAFGMPGADERILALSYPWIGHARGAIAHHQIHPQSHLVWAHIAKIILYYVMYEACQAAWSVVLYAKSIPEALPVWIYGFAMIWEYFSMVFVRSALSVHFFPRITLLYFVLYHAYFYSVPYGYFDVALIPLFTLMVHAMLYTILALEAPNAARGTISVECPREVYNRLSWPEWNAQLPSEWTMFLPLNSRQTPLYDREIPDGSSDVAERGGAEENGNTASPHNA